MFSASLYGVSTAATVAKVAIRGLLISTGVGAVIAALSMGVEYLVNKLTGATSATNADTTALENNQKPHRVRLKLNKHLLIYNKTQQGVTLTK